MPTGKRKPARSRNSGTSRSYLNVKPGKRGPQAKRFKTKKKK